MILCDSDVTPDTRKESDRHTNGLGDSLFAVAFHSVTFILKDLVVLGVDNFDRWEGVVQL